MAKSSLKQPYRYSGPVTPLTAPDGEERMLYPGTSYSDLPDSDTVKNLIETGVLVAELGSASQASSMTASAAKSTSAPVSLSSEGA